MKTQKFISLFKFAPKSKVKAGDGLDEGNFPFYTSSSILKKRIDKAQHFDEALIFGTGGSASIHFSDEPFATSTDCIVAINEDENLNTKYVYYYLFGNIHLLERGFKGAGLKHISKIYIENLDIPIIPIETQNKIVFVLDITSSIVQKRINSIELIEDFLKNTFLEIFGDPVFNRKKWRLERIENVIQKIDAGWSPVCEKTSRTYSNEYAVLKQGAVSRRFFDSSQNKLLPNNLPIKKEVLAEKGDLLFSRKNTKDMVGSAAYVFENYEKLLLPDTIFNLRYNSTKVSGIYLYYLFNDNNYRKKIQELKNGAAASMPNISQKKLLNHQIPLPKKEIQFKFESTVLNTYEKRRKVENSLNHLKILFSSIIQKVFNGQLNFNVDFELDALINEIDLQKKENDLAKISGDIAYLQRLIDKLNDQEFTEKDLYDKAKHGLFQLMTVKEQDRKVIQEYHEGSKTLKLALK